MSQNSYSQSLMGFSVHQTAPGALLQFFPEMGSQQLDEMIDAYVPGTASIQDKRTTVSLEFCEHSMLTGEMYKFFLVYPPTSSSTASPASTLQDSGYASSFNASPVVNQSLWNGNEAAMDWPFAASPKKASSKKAAPSSSRTPAGDFSHIPGMKIMTKEGLDVTNAASRGCKTKEQRDHAHLMRIIKACDSCKRKKTRCDPSHKKRGSSATASPEPKVSNKKVKKAAPPPKKKQLSPAAQAEITFDSTFDFSMSEPLSFDADLMAAAESTANDWDQFITFNEEITNVPQDYDFFFDTTSYYSPVTTDGSASASSSQVLTPGLSQPVTPAYGSGLGGGDDFVAADLLGLGNSQQPVLPYLHDSSAEVGNNYVDFALYSPGSSCLGEDPALSSEIAAAKSPDFSEEQTSTGAIQASQSTLRGGVAMSSQRSSSRSGNARNAFTLEDVDSVFAHDGLGQSSDQAYYDPGHDRDQGLRRSTQRASALSSYARASPHLTESRVPGATVSPSDTLLGLPPRPGVQQTSVAGTVVNAKYALADGTQAQPRSQPQLVTDRQPASSQRTVAANDGLGAAVRLTSAPLSPVVQSSSGNGHHLTRPVHQRLRKRLASRQSDGVAQANVNAGTVLSSRASLADGLVVATHSLASNRNAQQDTSVAIAKNRNAQQDTSVTIANRNAKNDISVTIANRDAKNDISVTIAKSRNSSQDVYVPRGKTISPLGSGLLRTISVASSEAGAAKSGRAGALAAPVASIHSGLFPVNGLLAACAAYDLQSTAKKPAKLSELADGALPALQNVQLGQEVALLSSLLVLVCAHLLSQFAVGYSPSLACTSFIMLSLVATLSLQQYPVSCANNSRPLTHLLGAAGHMFGGIANSVKPQIQETQSRFVSFRGNNALGRQNSATLTRINVGIGRLGMV
ncbi:hypothetical protein LQW54_012255 [Pestalotiopsis sp. IQ-011]